MIQVRSTLNIRSRRIPWLGALMLIIASLLTGCSATPTAQKMSTPAITPTPTASATLPPLSSESGWHNVFALVNKSGNEGVQKSFTASKSYEILYACKGSGQLTVSYGQHTEITTCTATPEGHLTDVQQPTSPDETVIVSVIPSGAITWELLVSMQD